MWRNFLFCGLVIGLLSPSPMWAAGWKHKARHQAYGPVDPGPTNQGGLLSPPDTRGFGYQTQWRSEPLLGLTFGLTAMRAPADPQDSSDQPGSLARPDTRSRDESENADIGEIRETVAEIREIVGEIRQKVDERNRRVADLEAKVKKLMEDVEQIRTGQGNQGGQEDSDERRLPPPDVE